MGKGEKVSKVQVYSQAYEPFWGALLLHVFSLVIFNCINEFLTL